MITIMSQMNPEQQRAIDTTDGPVLIIAGAGSGKTRVITHRILNLIKKGVTPQNILAITFTNKAAKEMRERVEKLLTEDKATNRPISMHERPFLSTFHSLGVHIIKENAGLLGLTRHFTIFDRNDSRRAIKDAMEKANVDPKKFEPGMMLNKISLAKGDGMTRIEYADKSRDAFEEMVANVWEKYESILTKEKALDFDDLLLKTARLLENHKDVRKHYGGIWKYIHIDEYQDTNKVQYKIARLLTDGQLLAGQDLQNICVVGDTDQSIYSWRGATIENISNFERDYADSAVIVLEENYRSTKNILDAANMVIEKNTDRRKKVLRTANASGDKLSLLVSYTETHEAQAIAKICGELLEKGVSPTDIAVLYRANFQSRALEEAFIKQQLPYQLLGIKFFERKEVKDVLSYVKAALNRDSLGDISRIINVPVRGIGKVTLIKVLANQIDTLPEGMRVKVSNFYKLLDDIKQELLEKKPSEAIKFIIQETGMEKDFRAKTSSDGEDEERLMNVRELVSVAMQYDNVENGIEKFLEHAALSSDQDEIKSEIVAIKLMTVHASKGLEFDYVFVAGLEHDLFPFKHVDDGKMGNREDEEERRLFYVAITRAKKKLYLSHAIIRTIYGAQKVNTPSEFITDIDESLIDGSPSEPTSSGAKAIFIDF